jgi:hypothetical protein
VATALITHRKARVVPITDADKFLTGVQQKISILEKTSATDPLSITLIVNSAKTYVGKSEHRVHLSDLVERQ